MSLDFRDVESILSCQMLTVVSPVAKKDCEVGTVPLRLGSALV